VNRSKVLPLAHDRSPPPPGPVSFEEFMAWADEDTHAEWVDGEILLMSPSNVEHLDLIGFLYTLVGGYVRANGLGRLFFAGLLMRLPTRPSGREPDLVFIAAAHANRLRETYLDGPADLVVEIVSPDSVERDRVDKLAEYETAGIPEYWLIDPLRRDAAFHRLGADGRYRLAPADTDGIYRSPALAGFPFSVAWLWQRPLPNPAIILQRLGV
jgi:Uma2 family endonuclease